MYTRIAAFAIALASSAAMSDSFDFERQIDTPALFPTVASEQGEAKTTGLGRSPSFAYEQAIGAPELFSTLHAAGTQVVTRERGEFSAMEAADIVDPSILFGVE